MYLGDYGEDETIYLIFNTFTSDDPSASCTITNFINTDVHIHKDDGLSQRNNAAGITVSVNFDGITGSHLIKIDTNDNTVAGFWVTGHDYFVRIEGTTIDGATINAVVGHFSIQNRYMRGTAGANTTVPDAAGVAPTAAEIKTEVEQAGSSLALILADTGELQTNQGNWLTATGFSTHNAAAVWAVASRILTANTNFNDLNAAAIKAEVVAALADIKLDHLINIAVDTDWATTVHLDSVIGHMADVGTAATFDRTQESMEAIRARGDAAWIAATGFSTHSAADVKTAIEQAGSSIAHILADTGELQTDWHDGGRLDVLLDACNTTTPPTVFEIADQVWDEILTGAIHNIATSAGRRVREIGAYSIHSGTAQAGDSNSITIAASASPSDPLYNGIFNRNLIVLVDNTGVGQTRTIVDYDAVTKVCVMDRDWRITPDATTTYQITPDDTPLTVDHGVARGGTSRTITIREYAASDDDAYLCNIVTIIAGAGRGQARLVDSYDGTTKVVTICGDDWVVNPDTTSIYVMMPYGVACAACMGSESLTQIADCVWDEDITTHTTPNSASWFIQKIKSIANFIRIKLL